MLKLYHIKITVRQHCVNNSSKIIKNNGNNKFIVYFCIRYCVLLHKISCGSAVSSPVKLRFTVLLLHSPRIVFVEDKLHSGKYEQAPFPVSYTHLTLPTN